MTKEVVSRLHDDNGRLRSFSEFAEAVQPYVSHQNRAWLQTEYSTAVRRAHDAADWQQFEAEKDVLPNLRWMPSTSAKPGQDHMEFWGTVLPVDDPFWKEHRPGDRWNCKCSLSSTDDEPTSRPTAKESTPQPGLKTKPTDAELFSQDHPYYADSCTSCPFHGSKLMALLHDLSGKRDCNSCSGVNKKLENKAKEWTKRQRINKKREAFDNLGKEWKKELFDEETGGFIASHKLKAPDTPSKNGGHEAEVDVNKRLASHGMNILRLPDNVPTLVDEIIVDGKPYRSLLKYEDGKETPVGYPDNYMRKETWDIKYIGNANEGTIRKYIWEARKADNVIFFDGGTMKMDIIKTAALREFGKRRKMGTNHVLPNVYYEENGILIPLWEK